MFVCSIDIKQIVLNILNCGLESTRRRFSMAVKLEEIEITFVSFETEVGCKEAMAKPLGAFCDDGTCTCSVGDILRGTNPHEKGQTGQSPRDWATVISLKAAERTLICACCQC